MSSINSSVHLAWGDVTLDNTMAPTMLKHLKKSKTDQLKRGGGAA